MALDGATQDRSVGSPGSRQHGVLVVVPAVPNRGLNPFGRQSSSSLKLLALTVLCRRRLITYGSSRREERRTDDLTGRRPDLTTGEGGRVHDRAGARGRLGGVGVDELTALQSTGCRRCCRRVVDDVRLVRLAWRRRRRRVVDDVTAFCVALSSRGDRPCRPYQPHLLRLSKYG